MNEAKDRIQSLEKERGQLKSDNLRLLTTISQGSNNRAGHIPDHALTEQFRSFQAAINNFVRRNLTNSKTNAWKITFLPGSCADIVQLQLQKIVADLLYYHFFYLDEDFYTMMKNPTILALLAQFKKGTPHYVNGKILKDALSYT